ncbi:putative c-8 acyltransferase [Rosellinia necatrix]|uniref:Putative c-8 acyltransferase n=1 Tax=Rosellinia necatrix TaxID=77044 RepID=A0A1S7UNM5_ROSNE|nr:putative c-8 acyltransferase [Rosellinia necatrix]
MDYKPIAFRDSSSVIVEKMQVDLQRTFGHRVRKRRQHQHQPSSPVSILQRIHRTPSDPYTTPRNLTMQASSCCPKDEPLSVFNQCSPRGYISVVLCFPCDDSRREDAASHIRQSLIRLANKRPLFSGRLYTTSDGIVMLRRSRDYSIPFEVISNDDGTVADYEQLKHAGFPPAAFVHPRYGIPGLVGADCSPIPVSKVDVTFVRGGLLLSVFLQHAITDGGSLKVFLEALGNQTRNISDRLPSEQRLRIRIPEGAVGHMIPPIPRFIQFMGLMAMCPEYAILEDRSGPTQPQMRATGLPIADLDKIGKIFVFTTKKLDELRKIVKTTNKSEQRPTAYMSLAALAFAHITKARIRTEPALTGIEAGNSAMLWNSVNWRPRAFPGATHNYFGNAVLPARTNVTRELANAACHDHSALARLVPLIKRSIDVIDEEHVRRRMAMMSCAPDPRLVGVSYDPRSPEILAFNTWRHFGADVEWNIPGVPVSKPDTIRRATGGWGLGTALLLPAQQSSARQELYVSLSVGAMEALCQDERWMEWVDRVIG